jgi:hypothetical protein
VPELEKAYLELEGGDKVPCLYNPETLSVGRANSWVSNPMPGKGVPRLQYAGAAGGWMRIDLWFDTTADGSPVTKHTGKLMKLMEVDPDLPGTDVARNNARPPTVVFHWGDLHSFRAVVSDLRLSFTYFSSSGTPRPSRVHRVQPGETLDRISARYYGDATQWRRLAVANGVQDPLALRPGVLLDIPRES